ncbi:hypothetical protein H310_08592 [Aphanomyces invadans]|uniref:PCIF1 WW domain-containing protein n=1 Tax=Aphanomyces invadans TaxID=157072 RepID=A0A024TWC3_9STRA|nr:hypothetical protein H310_08592 [Aphanomyces invadans]ETV98440.1 hypothetical protein H310_08592 [Aphanomyces invadans]|eukprot:XP_008872637.1 hypothetical protein H310_08592 [Aphanomyces invadans]
MMDDVEAILNSMAAKTGNVSAISVDEPTLARSKPAPKKRMSAVVDGGDHATTAIWNEHVQVDVRHVASSEHNMRPCNLQSVSPAYELHRQKCVLKLKAKLHATVDQLGLPKLPNSAYETWQFCSKLAAPDGDPLIPHADSDYAGLRDELVAIGANRHAANKICRAMTQEAHRVGQSLLRMTHGGGKKRATIRPNDDHYLVSYGGTSLRINKTHLDKLETLFGRHHAQAGATSASQFPDFLFCLLLRYESLDGGGFQAALNEECFDVLLRHFKCNMECFASPFNSRYGRFCSAFLDTDRVFGSFGSFFDFRPTFGCFEANPPFVPALIAKMAAHMTTCLQNTSKSLCFIVIIPAWEHTEGWQLLKHSSYNKEYLVLSQKHHGYCEGKQQMRPTRYRIASFDTSVFFWQNAKAAARWPVTERAIEDLRRAFKSKQADERDELGLKHGGKKVKRVKQTE